MRATLFRRITLLMVLGGVSLIYLATSTFTPETKVPGDIENGDIGAFIRVNGEIRDPRTHDGTQFFTVAGPDGTLDAVSFTPIQGLADGRTYTISGRVNVYQGDLELVVDAVRPTSGANR